MYDLRVSTTLNLPYKKTAFCFIWITNLSATIFAFQVDHKDKQPVSCFFPVRIQCLLKKVARMMQK